MKSYCIFVLALVAGCSAETYTSENDNLDIEGVVNDPTTLQAFVNCFNDKGDCDVQTADFKKDMPEAIREACAKCTQAQKHIFKIFLKGLKEKLPSDFEFYKNKYDADNKYFTALEAAIANA